MNGHLLFGPVLIDPNIIGLFVSENKILQESIFKCSSRGKALPVGANFWFQTDQVEIQLLGCHHTLNELSKASFTATGQEHCDSILLLHAELNQVELIVVSKTVHLSWRDPVASQYFHSTNPSKLAPLLLPTLSLWQREYLDHATIHHLRSGFLIVSGRWYFRAIVVG